MKRTHRTRAGIAALWLLTSLTLLGPAHGRVTLGPSSRSAAVPLTWSDRMAIERVVGEHDAARRPTEVEGGFALRSGGTDVLVDRAGGHVGVGEGRIQLGAVRVGRADAGPLAGAGPLAAEADVIVSGAEVQLARSPEVREWWRSLPSGLEHGVTIARRPSGAGPLRVELATDADVEALGADEVVLRAPNDSTRSTSTPHSPALHYGRLVAFDARGHAHPASLAAADHRIRIDVDDRDAVYPLVIDPLVVSEEAALLPAVPTSSVAGCSVASNRDGTVALVGAYNDASPPGGSGAGSVHVFVRSGTSWREAQTLVPSDSAAGAFFGIALAITPDASRILVGASYDSSTTSGSGSVYVFAGAPGTYTEEAKLVVASAQARDYLGGAVAISDDGSIAIGAASWADTTAGADAGTVYAFARSGTSWALEATLAPSHGGAAQHFGYGVAIASDGSRVAVGALDGETTMPTGAGEGFVFRRVGGAWVEEANLVAMNGALGDWLGATVAMSAAGDRVALGAPYHSVGSASQAGEIVVFARAGTVWFEEASLTDAQPLASDRLGSAIAMSADGSIVVGGERGGGLLCSGSATGRLAVFTRNGVRWTEESTIRHAGALVGDRIGYSVALSGDGTRVLAGGLRLDGPSAPDSGGALVFALRTCGPGGGCCNVDADCDDGNPCTSERCSGPGGTCAVSAVPGCCTTDGDCDDCNGCTADVCSPSGCTHSAAMECDAGLPDGGLPDASLPDAGVDAGLADAGRDGGGALDATATLDGGTRLDGSVDGSVTFDAGGSPDAGPVWEHCRWCGCGVGSGGDRSAQLALAMLALVVFRRRRRASSPRA